MRGGGLGGMLGGGRRRGGGMRLPIGKKSGGGLIGIIVIVGITLLLGGDLGSILGQVSGGGGQPSYAPAPATGGATGVRQTGQAQQDELAEFVAVVLGDTEDTWHKIFKSEGATYREPNLVLFDGSVRSACGLGQSAMGPFYCPGDQKVYIDLSFFRDLRQRFKAPGDFAQAYVIAHEVGHHVQTLIGVSAKVQEAKRRMSKRDSNALQVKMELQADCFAGVWAHHADRARSILEAGDIDEALRAAAAIGDDRIQRQSQGYVSPESFTHGSSAQRQPWFKQGLQDGRVATCDTFSARNL
jgi:predicted metalloprotease